MVRLKFFSDGTTSNLHPTHYHITNWLFHRPAGGPVDPTTSAVWSGGLQSVVDLRLPFKMLGITKPSVWLQEIILNFWRYKMKVLEIIIFNKTSTVLEKKSNYI